MVELGVGDDFCDLRMRQQRGQLVGGGLPCFKTLSGAPRNREQRFRLGPGDSRELGHG